ncbi:hypothetical protein EDD86DRAFT_217691 [Gorgonomyces haynaldii]|nr:hypothetical protein EDD86DRAFT_217691 [Gorgonomyces haynaldii]
MEVFHPISNTTPRFITDMCFPMLSRLSRSFSRMDTSLSSFERSKQHVSALLPPIQESFETQLLRINEQLKQKPSDLERYMALSQLRVTQPDVFYRLILSDCLGFTPLIYTPTVGLACQKWSHIYTHPEGLYLPITAKGNLYEFLGQWPEQKVDICVVTDGGRVLGLGDQGIGGLGISIGKLSLYTACAGVHPQRTLPLVFDFGTNNEQLLQDPLYLGLRQPRCSEQEQMEFVDEFMEAVNSRFKGIIVQFEDFSTERAFEWLDRYRHSFSCFNDDIQGTGAVILAGFQKAVSLSLIPPQEQRIVFYGAGSAGVGVAKMLSQWIERESGLGDQCKRQIWLIDSKGLICINRGDKLAEHKLYFARDDVPAEDLARTKDLMDILDYVKPTCLIGLSTVGGVFTPQVIQKMAQLNPKPIIMPLSNPVSKSECTFEDAMIHTNGKVIFCSGSPFPELEFGGRTWVPGQGNNMYIFPGLGLGAILSRASEITDDMIFAAADALAKCVLPKETERGLIYPEMQRIRETSLEVTVQVILKAVEGGVGKMPPTDNLYDWVKTQMYDPYQIN